MCRKGTFYRPFAWWCYLTTSTRVCQVLFFCATVLDGRVRKCCERRAAISFLIRRSSWKLTNSPCPVDLLHFISQSHHVSFHAKRLYTIKLFMWSKTMRHISIKLSCRLFSSFVLWFIFQMHYTKYCKDLLSNSAVEQVLIISIHFQFQNQYNDCCNVNSLKMGNGKNLTPCRQELVMERHDTALHQ